MLSWATHRTCSVYPMKYLDRLVMLCFIVVISWVLFGCMWLIYLRFMMTSSNRNIFRVTGPLCGEFTGPGEFPAQRPVTRSFDVFFNLRPNKRLSKQFETPSRSLWRHCNVSGCFIGTGTTVPVKPPWRMGVIILSCRFKDKERFSSISRHLQMYSLN